uniref:Leucine zipper transcription factor-like protein 1 n=1 Tax=Dendroctonus ponderosae TaxID=77166 RepID=A0AAR5P9P3_DENPD
MQNKVSECRRIEGESKSTDSMQQENITLKNKLGVLERENQHLHEKNLALEHQNESVEQRLQENKRLNSQLRDMISQLKSDDHDKLRAERDLLKARTQELEKQVAHLEISLRKRVQLFTNLSLHLKELQDQKEASLKDVRKFEPEVLTQIEPVLQSKKLVVHSKQGLTMADLFGRPVNKVHVQDNSSQTVTIADQEPYQTCCKSDERKSALRVSDEMRKVKERRQSIHDQRRGLFGDVERSSSLDNFDCESCASLRNKAVELRSQTTALTDEVDNLKSENKFLDKENADMLQMIRNYQERELELDNKLMKYEQCEKVDKETQATCDLQQKYNALKRILRLRKREAMSTES